MKDIKPSHILAGIAWAFTFILGTQIATRKISVDLLSFGMFGLFFLVALMASAVAQGKPVIKDLRVKVGGNTYTQESGVVDVVYSKNGAVIVYITLKPEDIVFFPADLSRPSIKKK